MAQKPRQIQMQSKVGDGRDAAAGDEVRRGAARRDALQVRRPGHPRRPRRGALRRQARAREHFRTAIAAARPQERLQLRRMAEASLALAERRPDDLQGRRDQARPDPAVEPPAAGAALHGPDRPGRPRARLAPRRRRPAADPARRRAARRSAGASSS